MLTPFVRSLHHPWLRYHSRFRSWSLGSHGEQPLCRLVFHDSSGRLDPCSGTSELRSGVLSQRLTSTSQFQIAVIMTAFSAKRSVNDLIDNSWTNSWKKTPRVIRDVQVRPRSLTIYSLSYILCVRGNFPMLRAQERGGSRLSEEFARCLLQIAGFWVQRLVLRRDSQRSPAQRGRNHHSRSQRRSDPGLSARVALRFRLSLLFDQVLTFILSLTLYINMPTSEEREGGLLSEHERGLEEGARDLGVG